MSSTGTRYPASSAKETAPSRVFITSGPLPDRNAVASLVYIWSNGIASNSIDTSSKVAAQALAWAWMTEAWASTFRLVQNRRVTGPDSPAGGWGLFPWTDGAQADMAATRDRAPIAPATRRGSNFMVLPSSSKGSRNSGDGRRTPATGSGESPDLGLDGCDCFDNRLLQDGVAVHQG